MAQGMHDMQIPCDKLRELHTIYSIYAKCSFENVENVQDTFTEI